VLGIAEQLGIKIDPSWVQLAQAALQKSMEAAAAAETAKIEAKANTQHGGKLAQQESLSKHHADNTGAMQGLGGAPATLAPGGGVM
jgi:hypothetical protein